MTAASAEVRPRIFFRGGVLPGFRLALGFSILYLSLIVLLPLAALLIEASSLSWREILATVSGPRALAAFRLSFGASFAGAAVNALLGSVVAWVLARYRFPGRRLVDALVDLPFALPTAVAGIALTAVYAPAGWIGRELGRLGLQVAFAPAGVMVALTFVGLPFVVRTVEPVLAGLDPQAEEAAAVLGAGRWRTFARVVFPAILPALLTGSALAFARALGEYGSIVFISGNLPQRTEIVPVLIVDRLEQYDYAGATAIASVMLVASFSVLVLVNVLQARMRRRSSPL
ncbi:MAG: sulfate ABC transporter permease subunit CysT [Myxococcales bacterium]